MKTDLVTVRIETEQVPVALRGCLGALADGLSSLLSDFCQDAIAAAVETEPSLPAGESAETPSVGVTPPAASIPADAALVSEGAIELIRHFESCKEIRGDGWVYAYADPAHGWNVPTIGWGTTRYPNGSKVKRGDRITKDQAEVFFRFEIAQKAAAVRRLLDGTAVTRDQFGALVSFAYNLGEGNLGKSTLLKRLRAGRVAEAADEFLKWDKAAGKRMDGLTRRRQSERRLFLGVSPAIVTMEAFREMKGTGGK